ncbi:MAG: helix-turn-helix domain-containing protein [Aeriscardovia sp.]|nr:helix-turn-helix domain-containing protein [Aeriscardovia sp.]
MSNNKYIGTKDAARLTGLTIQEIYDLIHKGKISAHKAPKSGWRILYSNLEELGLIKSDIALKTEKPESKDGLKYVAEEEHFTEVFKMMTEVKHSLKIATANLKNFSVEIGKGVAVEKLRLCDFFLLLVERGVQVQVVCMKPFGFYLYAKENCPKLLENPLFELRCNEQNHMKVFIFDDECAYIGSANITGAAIGKRASGNRNYEAGMLVWGPNMIQYPIRHFEKVWNDPIILKSTWKRFEERAKELNKELKEKYGR